MTIQASIETVRSACEKLGAHEMARRSGVPYTTIRSLAERGYRPKSAAVLETLERVALAYVAETNINAT